MLFESILLEPTYLPPITWWAYVAHAQQTFVQLYAPYRKQSLMNRCYIKGPNEVQALTAFVERGSWRGQGPGQRAPFSEVAISYHEGWPRHHTRTLETALAPCPFYDHYVPDVLAHLAKRPTMLADVCLPLLELVTEHLGLHLQFIQQRSQAPQGAIELAAVETHIPAAYLQPVAYHQPFGPFASGLSILDLLCNTGPEAIGILKAMHHSKA